MTELENYYMLRKIKNWFSKNGEVKEYQIHSNTENSQFILRVDNINVGVLNFDNDFWTFKYSAQFKQLSGKYRHIVGFPDLEKTYQSEILWPFFQIRIPGLKQPEIKEILRKEKIDQNNEAALLKRFGKKSISNPYELISS